MGNVEMGNMEMWKRGNAYLAKKYSAAEQENKKGEQTRVAGMTA